MKRVLLSVLFAGAVFSGACGGNTSPMVMSPTPASADFSAPASGDPNVEKYYTVGGVVQSVQKPFLALEGARIEAFGIGNDGRSTISGSGGAFSLSLKAGNVTLVVTKDGYDPWSTKLALYEHQPDVRPMLMPRR